MGPIAGAYLSFSYFSSSNFTMSCSGTDDHDIEPSTSGCR